MTQKPPFRLGERTDIVKRGVDVESVPGLVSCDRATFEDDVKSLGGLTKDSYTREELFGRWINNTEYIAAPVDAVFEYLSNPYSVEEFTATLRGVEYVGGGLYRAWDKLAPNTYIYMRFDVFPEARVVDTVCAWDQGLELWMRYNFRLLDAQEVLKQPGTVLLWNNCRHPYYDRESPAPDFVAGPRNRTDRPWVGDFWNFFYTAHGIEARNLKLIMEERFREK